jgi:hypothetical protein
VDKRDALLQDASRADLMTALKPKRYAIAAKPIICGEVAVLAWHRQIRREIHRNVATLKSRHHGAWLKDVSGTNLGAACYQPGRSLGTPKQCAHVISARDKPRNKVATVDSTRTQHTNLDCHIRLRSLLSRMGARPTINSNANILVDP